MMRDLEKLLTPIRRRIALLLARGSIHLSKSAAPHQRLQLELIPGEVLDDVEHFEPYGFTSNPLVGAEVIAASLAGDRTRAIAIIASDRRHRKQNLTAGEVSIYTDEGDYILLKRGRVVEVFAGTKVKVTAPEAEIIASTKVTITSPLTAISGNTTIGGTLNVTGAVTMQATANVAGIATVGGLVVTGAAGPATVAGNLAITGGNVTADGIGLKTHTHGGVQTGGSSTGVPQ